MPSMLFKFALVSALGLVALQAQTAPKITSPQEALGFRIGDDYQVATYTQLETYWKKLDAESDRMTLQSIGKTEEGRPQYMAILTSPENHKKLDRYKEISRRLAHAEGLSDEEARALAREGKTIVWIDGGLHATETVGAQQLMELVYQTVSSNDPEMLRFLNDTILLAVHANPDGQELVAGWYMREPEPTKRSLSQLPRLYQKYAGHDNNRDFYMSNLAESTNMNRILYREWFPQIMYNHHQTGPRGAVIFVPPFRDPFNYNFDPLIPLQIEMLGSAMHSRFVQEGKPGSAMRNAASYSTWYNGGLRTTTYFHNMIGILTEIIGSPTPAEVPIVAERQIPSGDLPFPVPPQTWHYRQSIDYSMTSNRALLDFASRYRETLLFNIYRMGKNSIDRGNKDSWTITPKRIEALKAASPEPRSGAEVARTAPGIPVALFEKVLHSPETRDPRGYVLPADQADFPTAIAFTNTMIKNGIDVHRATSAFTVAGKSYPAGSIVIKSAQAFRPYVLDMFEPQDHPNDLRYPGGPPIAPYDNAGWTLAYQMGVKFERLLEKFDGPFEKVTDVLPAPAGAIVGPANPAGYLISHKTNRSFTLANRLMKQNQDVFWLKKTVETQGVSMEPGTLWVPSTATARGILTSSAKDLGLTVYGVAAAPPGAEAFKLKPVRIGLFDQYGGSMPSGWTRFVFEQFEFPFEVVYAPSLDSGDLRSKFDVLVFPDGTVRPMPTGQRAQSAQSITPEPIIDNLPAEYKDRVGRFSADKTLPQLKKFIESGGTVISVGSSVSLAEMMSLPVKNGLTEKAPDGRDRPLPREKFYVPGSILQAKVDTTSPLAFGASDTQDVFFENSPTFRLSPDAAGRGVKAVSWFAGPNILRSGWAWGEQYLDGAVGMVEATVGEGKLFLLGPDVTFRGQPHGTFKFLFNGIYYGSATSVVLGEANKTKAASVGQ